MTLNVFPVDAVAGAPNYTGQTARQPLGALWGKNSTRPLGARSGIHPATPAAYITATSTTWTVGPHCGVLDVEASATAGPYPYAVDANVTGSVNAANATNPRIDLLSIQLSDPAQGDGSSAPGIAIIYTAGTAAASPVAPATPARAIALAQITVPAVGGGSPAVALVAPIAVASGGILPTTSTLRPSAPYVGQYIDDPTLGLMRWSGALWIPQKRTVAMLFDFAGGATTRTQSQSLGFTYATPPSVIPVSGNDENFYFTVDSVTTTAAVIRAFYAPGSTPSLDHNDMPVTLVVLA